MTRLLSRPAASRQRGRHRVALGLRPLAQGGSRLAPILAGGLLGFNGAAQEATLPVEVCTAAHARHDAIAEVALPAMSGGGVTDVLDAGRPLAFQADPGDAGIDVTVLLAGDLASESCREIDIVRGGAAKQAERLVSADRMEDYRGEPTIRIKARNATYYFHEGGAGFASLIDIDGNDWISYRPEGGFKGHYRGIPNIAPPDFHPGRPEGKQRSRIAADGPVKVRIESGTQDGLWRVRWDIFPDFARMTLLAKGPEPYWILYEGTPGGSFDAEWDYWRDSAGREMPMPAAGELWNGQLPEPQWVFFADRRVRRGLFLALDRHDDQWDEFWHRGSGGMTVFGFGRGPKPQWQYLEAVPAQLTIGLVEDSNIEAVRARVESAWRPLEYRIGKWTAATR